MQEQEMMLTPREGSGSYNLALNESTMDILSLVFEFKLAASWHIARFLMHKDQSKHMYFKLRRMWRAHLLERCKVYSGSYTGAPVYYLLSEKGLKILEQQGRYDQRHIRTYPSAKALLHPRLFSHESQVVELASREVQNKSQGFNITFRGEYMSGSQDFRSDKSIETFTPDYTALYTVGDRAFCIYSEFERTAKSKEAMIQKIERYVRHLSLEERTHATLRFIFQTPNMEQSFWLTVIGEKHNYTQKIRIVTTNVLLIERGEQFLEPIYATEGTIKLINHGRLAVDTSQRIKLFSFL